MPRFRKPLYSLRKPKYRPSWNKYNLYNMQQNRVKNPVNSGMTYFQQKWHSKAATRTYHATTMRETDWRRIFRPDMRSVVSMDANYLGQYDGSDISVGRGAGRDNKKRRQDAVPYMNMVYHQLERRLDTAIWRAMFASSADQARQYCLHGFVQVNGKPMRYPGYLLNPGDLFQVDVERVMFATGDRKSYWECRFGRQDRRRGYGKLRRARSTTQESESIDSAEEAEDTSSQSPITDIDSSESRPKNQSKLVLQDLLAQAKATLDDPKAGPKGATEKRALRDFSRLLRKELGQKASWDTPIDEQIATLAAKLSLNSNEINDAQPGTNSKASVDAIQSAPLTKTLQADEERLISAALQQYKDNPVDFTKGYKTPWAPRPYMSPFAMIPRYLEVHAPICSAIYLRHPVARAGMGEVPTPFSEAVNGLAFNWYLRRR